MLARVRRLLRALGPGLITGASDDDPSGIATYSQAGARFGTGLLWTLAFTLPLMAAVQEISARLGRITGHGVAANLRAFYPRPVLLVLVLLLFVANTINLGADLAAMAEAVRLLVGGPVLLHAALLAGLSAVLEIWVTYPTYARVLKFATLVLFAYVGVMFLIRVDWPDVLRHTLVPGLPGGAEGLAMLVALLGTTISPYLLFWQSSEETEEMKAHPEKRPLRVDPANAAPELRRIRWDTVAGMVLSNAVAYFIVLAVAETLHRQGRTGIGSAAEAAEALKPLAGPHAALLFSVGILGTGLLAMPILAGSSAFAVGEMFGWPLGLTEKPARAKSFYLVIAAGFVLGWAFCLAEINPVRALIWSAVLNGILAAPLLAALMLMACSPKIMGPLPVRGGLRALGWITTAAMGLAGAALLLSTLRG